MLAWLHKKFKNEEEGQALVELAFVLPVLLLLIFGLIEFGSVYYSQLTINNASREGARLGAIHATSTGFDLQAEIEEVVENRTTALNFDNIDVHISPEEEEELSRGNDLKVHVEYQRKVMTPIMSRIISDYDNPGYITLDAATTMRIE